jgi:hypothetical protein
MRAQQFSDDRLVADLRAARDELGEPLTATAYDGWQRDRDAASPALLIRRFGSWNGACQRAGVVTNKTRSTSRRWSEEEIVAIVGDYLRSEGSTGSFGGYAAWARQQPDAPSGATLRQRYAWADLKARAREAPAR